MTGSVFMETLRRNWKAALIWGAGLFVYGVYVMVLIPDLEGLQRFVDIFESMPSGLLAAFGFEDASVMATPAGFLGLYLLYGMVIVAVYAVLSGLSLTANDEETGIMDMVLSLPLPRWRLIVEKFAAYSLMTVVISLMSWLGMVIGDTMNTNLDMPAMSLLEGNLNMVPSLILVIAVTGFIAAVTRRRGAAAALAGIFVTASFLLENIARSADSSFADALRNLSFFRHANLSQALADGVSTTGVLLLLVAAVVMISGAVFFYRRRDIAV